MSEVKENNVATSDDRPLVTFALFAYNQEQYIREAVLGAFSQTYEPLEIILSDDCSTDRTYEIMCEMAREYQGPHKVICLQTRTNKGTLLHVSHVADIASGELIVLSAGDDVSLSFRVSKIVEMWVKTGAWGFCSRYRRIDNSGSVLQESETNTYLQSSSYPLRRYFLHDGAKIQIVHGATSAYVRRLFSFLSVDDEDYILSEDGVMSVLLAMLEKSVCLIDEVLVSYREHPSSLTNGKVKSPVSFEETRQQEYNILRMCRSQANRCRLLIRMSETLVSRIELDKVKLSSELAHFEYCQNWPRLNLRQKVKFLATGGRTNLKWSIPRLLPFAMFIQMKAIIRSIFA